MSDNYVIQWKSTVNGRKGIGTKSFEREEAEQLAEELNREFPQIHHEAVNSRGLGESEETSLEQVHILPLR